MSRFQLPTVRRIIVASRPWLAAGLAAVAVAASANVPPPIRGLADERAAAAKAGLILSPNLLSATMPPVRENASTYYDRYHGFYRDPAFTSSRSEEMLMEKERSRPDTLTKSDWLAVQQTLNKRTPQIALIREAVSHPKCVFAAHEYIPKTDREEALNDPYIFVSAKMQSALRLLVSEGVWEAHLHQTNEAMRDLSSGFRMANQAAQHDTLAGYLNAASMDSLTVKGFQGALRLFGNDPGFCRAAQAAITKNWHPRRLSEALKIEAAIQQTAIDALIAAGPDGPAAQTHRPWNPEYARAIDDYGTFELREIRRCIGAADFPYAKSGAILQSIANEAVLTYPEMGELPNFVADYSGAVFQRDWAINNVNITRCASAVLAYHAEHGKYPATLADALPSPPVDTVDGKPLRYDVSATGFVLSANHQRMGHAPEPVSFRYPK